MPDMTVFPQNTAQEETLLPSTIDPAVVQQKVQEIDLENTQSILSFGAKPQEDLTALTDEMLEGVRNKDTGAAGDSLRKMVVELRGFDMDELNPNRKQSFFERVFKSTKPVAEFMAKYETVRDQIDKITNELNTHETTLLKDIKFLDKLYEKSLTFYHELAIYIAAGDQKLQELDTQILPEKQKQVDAQEGETAVLVAQELRDLRQVRDDLERRVHDLRLTRQVTMQSLPSIRLVQENDKGLVTKINSTLVNTIPLWQTQLAQAVTIQRSRDAASTIQSATDLTNDLLKSNADNLQAANREVRTQIERGVFDIESIKQANTRLIETIEDSLRISDEGKAKRRAAETELVQMENDLKKTLSSAKANTT
jgi:uncharacterized protein YaaN involved in tellurite resistance